MGEAYSGKNGVLNIGGTTMKTTSWTMNKGVDLNESTNMTSGGIEEFVAGIERYSLDFDAFAESGAVTPTIVATALCTFYDGSVTQSFVGWIESMNKTCTVDGNTQITGSIRTQNSRPS